MKTFNKATSIQLTDFKSPQMRAFHWSWIAFFFCFFGWFGTAPLMAVIRDELQLTKAQIGNIIIASVSMTIFARLFIGWLVDRIGPRLTYTYLLLAGSLPVLLIGFSTSYETFLIFRLAIGLIGASFVITQYHTSVMFAPNIVGTANATTAGWGNLGGGVTQMVMPLLFALFISLGIMKEDAWRYAMMVPGIAMILCGIAYYKWTTDFPEGNLREVRKLYPEHFRKKSTTDKNPFLTALQDKRVWALFFIYGACFGIELTIHNIAAIYYHDQFNIPVATAGIIAGLFGVMSLFARTLGGYLSDKAGMARGLKGRAFFLGAVTLAEGLSLLIFAQITLLPVAVFSMIIFGIFVQMSAGATYSIVPFINKKAIGVVSGIVGAGGNAGAVMAGFLFKTDAYSYSQALYILGIAVAVISFSSLLIRFSTADEANARNELEATVKHRQLQTELVNRS